jgi:3-hydroxybutyryl-CoA dehydrogenase
MGTALDVQTVAVIGAGDVGTGVARLAALRGLHVRLYDRSADSLRRAVEYIRQAVHDATAGGRLSARERQDILDGVLATTDLEEAVTGVDLVVDAAPDLLALKRELFREIGERCGEAPLATTSDLPLADVAGAAPRPAMVVGVRLGEPVEDSDRLEIVSLAATDLAAVERVRAFAALLGSGAAAPRHRRVP